MTPLYHTGPRACGRTAGIGVVGNHIMAAGKSQIEIGEGVRSAIVVGNRLRGGAKIVDHTGKAQIGFNTEE